jgi:hypothetical protein
VVTGKGGPLSQWQGGKNKTSESWTYKPPDREIGHKSFWEASLLSRPAVDLHTKAEPKNKGGFPYISPRAGYRYGGYSLSHTWSHTISLPILTSGARWPFSGLTTGATWHFPNLFFLFHCCIHYLSLSSPLLSCLPATVWHRLSVCTDMWRCD